MYKLLLERKNERREEELWYVSASCANSQPKPFMLGSAKGLCPCMQAGVMASVNGVGQEKGKPAFKMTCSSTLLKAD